jgi:hypothetical protein
MYTENKQYIDIEVTSVRPPSRVKSLTLGNNAIIPTPPRNAILEPYIVDNSQVRPISCLGLKRSDIETKFKMIDSIGPDIGFSEKERVELPTGLPNAISYTLYIPPSHSYSDYIRYGYTICCDKSSNITIPMLKKNRTRVNHMEPFVRPDPDKLYTMSDFGFIQMVPLYTQVVKPKSEKVLTFTEKFLLKEKSRKEALPSSIEVALIIKESDKDEADRIIEASGMN